MMRETGPTSGVIAAASSGEWAEVIAYQPRPEVWALVIGLGLAYLRATKTPRHGSGEPPSRRQRSTFLWGLLAMWAALDWPIDDVSDGSLLSVHMVQYLLLSVIAPGLFLLGSPPQLVERLIAGPRRYRLARLLRNPWIAWGVVSAVLLTSHAPAVVELYLANDLAHLAMHAAWLASGIVLWWPIVTRVPTLPPLVPLAQIAYLFVQSLVAIVPAAFLTFSATPIYDAYAASPKPSAIGAVADQQIAGVLMKLGGGLLLWTAIAVIFFRWAAQEDAAMAPPRPAGGPPVRG
jgi:putative membrane protein